MKLKFDNIPILLIAVMILLISPYNAKSQDAPSDYHPFLITFGNQANTYEGDHDHRQLVRFSVPLDIEGKLYVRVFDADTAGKYLRERLGSGRM